MLPLDSGPLKFGLYELDPLSGELRRRGLRVRLTPQATTLLCLLVEPPIRIRTREEIQRRLWPDHTFVDFERSLNKVVHSLREALEDSAVDPRFIETVASQGYRFLPPLAEQSVKAGRRWSDKGVIYLAVLPIDTDGEAELTFLAGRITSCLTDKLSEMDGVRVIAESTMKSCRLVGAVPQRVEDNLGVRLVLAGDLVRYDGVVYLHMELIDVTDGRQLHGAQVEGALQPGLRCEKEFAREVLDQISPALMELLAKGRIECEPLRA